jgi:hypothetical protein
MPRVNVVKKGLVISVMTTASVIVCRKRRLGPSIFGT